MSSTPPLPWVTMSILAGERALASWSPCPPWFGCQATWSTTSLPPLAHGEKSWGWGQLPSLCQEQRRPRPWRARSYRRSRWWTRRRLRRSSWEPTGRKQAHHPVLHLQGPRTHLSQRKFPTVRTVQMALTQEQAVCNESEKKYDKQTYYLKQSPLPSSSPWKTLRWHLPACLLMSILWLMIHDQCWNNL